MEIVEVNTRTLQAGPALDYAVMTATGWYCKRLWVSDYQHDFAFNMDWERVVVDDERGSTLTKLGHNPLPSVSRQWAVGLQEEYGISVIPGPTGWIAFDSEDKTWTSLGTHIPEAICRLVVLHEQGETVRIPKILLMNGKDAREVQENG